MGRAYLRCAAALGYRASFFNLVFTSNPHSIAIWESLGFKHTWTIPGAASLKGIEGYVDARQYYYDLTEYEYDGYFM